MCWHPLARKLQQRKTMSDKNENQHTAESGLPGMTCSPSLLTPETDAAWFAAHQATRFHYGEDQLVDADFARKLERERNEWKAIAKDALASFRCTQRPEIYPEGDWSRRAQNLLENDQVVARRNGAPPTE